MHEKLQEIIDYTANKFNLTDFHLKGHHFFKEKHHRNNMTYILSMEWIPNEVIDSEADFNPPGTIVIELDFHTKKLKRILFVKGINHIDADLPEAENIEAAIEWVEQESDLDFGRQFKLINSEGSNLFFRAAADNIAVFPSGYIQITFNEAGKLSVFSIDGTFPEEDQISWEPFNLTSKQTEDIIKQQCSLFEVPLVDKEKWRLVYGISTSFITNDGESVLSYEKVEADLSYTPINKVLKWDRAEPKEFPTIGIDINTETTLEAALENKQILASQPISKDDQQKVITMVCAYLQSIMPEDSGKWKMVSIRREASYLFAEVKRATDDLQIIQRKITVVLDEDSLEPINHIDNKALLDTFNGLEKAAEAKLNTEEAFEMLYSYVEMTPVYIYDKQSDSYVLCGKIDCEYAVDAQTGELMAFDDLN